MVGGEYLLADSGWSIKDGAWWMVEGGWLLF